MDNPENPVHAELEKLPKENTHWAYKADTVLPAPILLIAGASGNSGIKVKSFDIKEC